MSHARKVLMDHLRRLEASNEKATAEYNRLRREADEALVASIQYEAEIKEIKSAVRRLDGAPQRR